MPTTKSKRIRILKYDEPLVMLMQICNTSLLIGGMVYDKPRDVAQILYNKGVRLSRANFEAGKES